MPQLKISINHDALDCLSEAVLKAIDMYKESLEFNADTIDEDRLLIAALEELWVLIEKKRDETKYRARTKYKLTMSPVQGFAFRAAFAGLVYGDAFTTRLIGSICDQADNTFSHNKKTQLCKLPSIA